MQPHLKTAYILGAIAARRNFEKEAAGGDIATPIAGAFGTIPAALVGGLTAPEGRGIAGAGGAGVGALLGQLGGGVGGAALGGLGGAGYAALRNALIAREPWYSRMWEDETDPGEAALTGGTIGALLGAPAGGAYGAYHGRRAGIGEEHLREKNSGAMSPSTEKFILAKLVSMGMIPGAAIGGATGALTSDEGHRLQGALTGMGGGALLGGLGGLAGGAGSALGAGSIGTRPLSRFAEAAPLIGFGAGTLGGGLAGGYLGRAEKEHPILDTLKEKLNLS